ncbi:MULTISPECIES: hypothetical protein [unclassified Clostridium]|uniref:hypothetical protein n=1 Tax=unclassified Clostridium TaxID=2614128 RepID=UPI001C8C0BED|nr:MULTISPECIES: hypothetical protein [unclassified Clostridium]MBX9136642.1 hypothetical protein [Clostridium sp. K12(2020)]MBX9144836.1 hypothetical protein [Clostridium sp. K13]
MIFRDIVDNLKKLDELLNELKPLYSTSILIKDEINLNHKDLINKSIGSFSSGHYDVLVNNSKKLILDIKQSLFSIDLFELGELNGKLTALNNDFSNQTLLIIMTSLRSYTTAIRLFISSSPQEMHVNFSNLTIECYNFIHAFSLSKTIINEIVSFQTQLDNHWDGINEHNTFSLRLTRETITLSEMTSYNKAVENIYDILCRCLDIPSEESILLPVKIESGSWYAKLKGKEEIINIMLTFMTLAYTISSDNFSEMAKLKNDVEKANFIVQKLEMIESAENIGISISEEVKEKLGDEITNIILNTLTLTDKNTEIEINDKKIDLIPIEEVNKLIGVSSRPQLEEAYTED